MIGTPFTRVPFVEPRSSSSKPSGVRTMRACREEAEESYRAAQTLAEAIGWNEGVAVAHQALEAVARI